MAVSTFYSRVIVALSLATATVGCSEPPPNPPSQPESQEAIDPVQQERDEIFALLAYAVILKDWQDESSSGRGYNIGSVLVDSQHQVRCWARNSVNVTGNESQHGEVRLITNYLHNTEQFDLKGYRLYTTLEPCAMCGGMMTLTELPATVYGQTDPTYGKAIQRLEINSTSIGGYPPYPRPVDSIMSTTAIREELDAAFARAPSGTDVTVFLASEEAKQIHEDALRQFNGFQVEFPENEAVLEAAQAFLMRVPDQYTETPYLTNCVSAN